MRAPSGELLFGDDDKASLLNNYFAGVNTIDDGALPPCSSANCDPLFSIEFTPANVASTIDKLKCNLSSGPDNLPPLFLVKLKHVLSLPLAILFKQLNVCFSCPSFLAYSCHRSNLQER